MITVFGAGCGWDCGHAAGVETATPIASTARTSGRTVARRFVGSDMTGNVPPRRREGKRAALEQPERNDETENQHAHPEPDPHSQALLDGFADPDAIAVEQDGDDEEAAAAGDQ